jgi:serralysin
MSTANADALTFTVGAGGVVDAELYGPGGAGVLANDVYGERRGELAFYVPNELHFSWAAESIPSGLTFSAATHGFLAYTELRLVTYHSSSGLTFSEFQNVPVYGNTTDRWALAGQSLALAALGAGQTLQATFSYSIHEGFRGTQGITPTKGYWDFGESNTASVTVTFVGVNDAPVATAPIGNQVAQAGAAFSFVLPLNVFADVDTGDTLALGASALPSWLSYNAATRTLSGTPGANDAALSSIVVTATDSGGLSATNAFQIKVLGTSNGAVLDGVLDEWTQAQRLDTWQTGIVGYELYGRGGGDSFIIAIKAPMAIGLNTTVWINTDANIFTGYAIWGFAGGAEFNVNFDANGKPTLNANGVVVADLQYAFSADRTTVELAIPKALLGGVEEIHTLYDVNDTVFLPTTYLETQYKITNTGSANPAPVFTSFSGADSATLSVAENKTAVTTVRATDNGIVKYAILDGVDAMKFQVDSAGKVSFRAAPNFEAPGDANGDNAYDVIVAAVDSAGRTDTQTLHVRVTNVSGQITGSNSGETLTGTAEEDTISGLRSDDRLRGEAGNDTLDGGAGVDRLTGGAGGDIFLFASASDIGSSSSSRDIITDFERGVDRIDISRIDANTAIAGDQAFSLIAAGSAFTGAAQIRIVHSGSQTLIEGNTGGSLAPEFRIELTGNIDPVAADFIL